MHVLRPWFVLVVGSLGGVASISLLVKGRGGRGPWATLAWFVFMVAVAAWMITDQRRQTREIHDPGFEAKMSTGAEFVHDRRSLCVGALVMLGLGLTFTVAGGPIGAKFVEVGTGIAAFGVAVLVALGLGWRKGYALRFTVEGLQFSSPRLRYLAPWTGIAAVTLGEINTQPVVALTLHEPESMALTAEVLHGDVERERNGLTLRLIESKRRFDGHLLVSPRAYGIVPVVLLRAIKRCVEDRDARAALMSVGPPCTGR